MSDDENDSADIDFEAMNVLGFRGMLGFGSFDMSKTNKEVEEEERKKRLFYLENNAVDLLKRKDGRKQTFVARNELQYLEETSILMNKEKKAQFYRMRFSYLNYAHKLFCLDSSGHNIKMDLPKTMPQAVQQINEAQLPRQFDMRSALPIEQHASHMWARVFSVLEKAAKAEVLFENSFKQLFHDAEQWQFCNDEPSKRCACFGDCQNAQKQFNESFFQSSSTNTDAIDQARLRCVASGFFDQFFVPVAFARRNALHPDTCMSDHMVHEIRFERPTDDNEAKEDEFLANQKLLDVQLLSLADVVNLALSSLEHSAAMFAFPPKTLADLQNDVDEEAEMSRLRTDAQRRERRRCYPQETFFGPQASITAYNMRPENMQHRCPCTNKFSESVHQQSHYVQQMRKEINAERERKLELDREAFKKEEDKERLSMLNEQDYFVRKTHNESLKNDVHDKFSEERIEVYQTVVGGSSATAVYARFATHQENTTPYSPEAAFNLWLRHSSIAVDLKSEFEEFCRQHCKDIFANGAGLADESETFRIFGIFMQMRKQSTHQCSLEDIFGEKLASIVCKAAEKKITKQLTTPNYRAWCANVLTRLDQWLDQILTTVLQPAEQWLQKQQMESASEQQKGEFTAYCNDCAALAPWLFSDQSSKRQQQQRQPFLFQPRNTGLDDRELSARHFLMLQTQYQNNCTRLWSIENSVQYFNDMILRSDDRNAFQSAAKQFDKLLSTSLQSKSEELKLLLQKENELILCDQTSHRIWTVCCEPLMEGTLPFSIYPSIDPLCKNSLFAINQQRDQQRNPYALLHSYVWRVFRCDWPEEHHKLLPQIADFCDSVVKQFAKLRGVLSDCSYNTPLYLLSANAKNFNITKQGGEEERVAFAMRQIIQQFEANVKHQRLMFNESQHLTLSYSGKSESISESYTRLRRIMDYHAAHVHSKLAFERNYEFTIPYTTLYCIAAAKERKPVDNSNISDSMQTDSSIQPQQTDSNNKSHILSPKIDSNNQPQIILSPQQKRHKPKKTKFEKPVVQQKTVLTENLVKQSTASVFNEIANGAALVPRKRSEKKIKKKFD